MSETRCEECGAPVEDDMCVCYVCAQRNDEAEYEANETLRAIDEDMYGAFYEIRSSGRTEDE